MYNIFLIGTGAREHAILKHLKTFPQNTIFTSSTNHGLELDSIDAKIDTSDFVQVLEFCKQKSIDIVIVGPEEPLVLGICDFLSQNNIRCFGPNKQAAMLEGSKIWMKEVCTKAGIKTAKYQSAYSKSQAIDFVKSNNLSYPVVLKTDGLAAGKGVAICENEEDFEINLDQYFNGRFGEAGKKVIVEEFLFGLEVSFFALADGKNVKYFASACDYKKIGDNDTGKNTGGMGSFCPSFLTKTEIDSVMESIIKPVFFEIKKQNIEYKGMLFAGLMVSPIGEVYLIEFNIRLGDPETQSIMSLLKTNFAEIAISTCDGKISEQEILFSDEKSVTVVVASNGYPDSSTKGVEIIGDATNILHAGTKKENNKLLTSGGRVFCLNSVAKTFKKARSNCYETLKKKKVHFDGMLFRTDIAKRTAKLPECECKILVLEKQKLNIKNHIELFENLAKECIIYDSSHLNLFGEICEKYEISVLITDDEEISELNSKYRGKNKPTNVLSFPAKEKFQDRTFIGDIAISMQTVECEAKELNKSILDHLNHLFTHSVLHLLGYDHENDYDAEIMEEIEQIIIKNI